MGINSSKYNINRIDIKIFEDILFEILGDGQLYNKIRSLAEKYSLKNIKFTEPVKQEELPEKISEFDVCLGVFGKTEKAGNAIPNKVFQCIAMKKPVITEESSAIKEVFSHKENIFLCEAGNGKSLADAIIELKKNRELREKISAEGNRLFNEKFTLKQIGLKLKEELMK